MGKAIAAWGAELLRDSECVPTNGQERGILATAMSLNGEPWPPTFERVMAHSPESFAVARHGTVASVIYKLHVAGKPHRPADVVAALPSNAPSGAAVLVGDVMRDELPLALAEEDAKVLWERYTQRKLARSIKDAAEIVIDDPTKAGPAAKALRLTFDSLDMEEVTETRTPRSIGDLATDHDDGGELIRHRFLCRGGGMILAAPTGIGKSVLTMQAQLCFAVGRPCLGFAPSGNLRSLYIQAENDDGDLRELRDGILSGLRFNEEERQLAFQNVSFVTVDDLCGPEFIRQAVAPLVKATKPDIVWIDPLLSYLGGDVSRQEIVSPWVRNHLNPVLHRHNVASVLVHHTNKPPSGKEKPDWQAGDFAYVGSGSAELANWPRAVVAIRATGSHDVFELRLGKRGQRVGWKNADGSRVYSKHIAHGTDGIYWREAEADEIPATGRKATHTVNDIVELLAGELTATEWQTIAKTERGISERTFYRLKREAEEKGRVTKSKLTGKWITK